MDSARCTFMLSIFLTPNHLNSWREKYKIVKGLPSMAVNSFKRPKPPLTTHTVLVHDKNIQTM